MMEVKLVFDSEEELIGNYAIDEIAPLASLLRESIIIDIEGRTWIVENRNELFFNSYPPYFYLVLDSNDAS